MIRRVPVHGLRLAGAGTGPESGDRDQEQRLDHDEHADGPPEDVLVEPVELGREIGTRNEDRLRIVSAAATGEDQEQNGGED